MKKSLLAAVAVVALSVSAANAAPVKKQTVETAPVAAKQLEPAKNVTPYVSAKLARGWDKIKFKGEDSSGSFQTWGGDIAVGAKIGDARAELEYGFTKAGSKTSLDEDGAGNLVPAKIKFGMQTVMLNGYYDFRNDSVFTPYVGAGIGFADMTLKFADEDGAYSKSKVKFAYGLKAGVGIEVAKNVTVDVGYRYLKPSVAKYGYDEIDNEQIKMKTHMSEATVGVRFAF